MSLIMAQVVGHWSVNAKVWVQSQASPYAICGGQSGNETGFSANTSVFVSNYHCPSAPCSFIHLSLMLYDASS